MSKIAKLCEIFHSHLSFFLKNLLIIRVLIEKINLSLPKVYHKILISNPHEVPLKDQSPAYTYVYVKDWSLPVKKIDISSLWCWLSLKPADPGWFYEWKLKMTIFMFYLECIVHTFKIKPNSSYVARFSRSRKPLN